MPPTDSGGIIKWALSVCLSVWKRERPRRPKFGRMEAHHTGNPWTYLEVKRSKVKVARSRDAFDRLADKSRTKRPRNTKIGRKVVHCTGNSAHQFQGQRSKVKVTRPTNAQTGSASYLPNQKAYEHQTWYTDGTWRPASATSAVASKVKRQGRKVMWRVWQVLNETS